MNDWNQLENLLTSWKLREPSARLSARLFPHPSPASPEVSWLAARHWLAPAMAVCLLAVVVSQSSTAPWSGWSGAQASNLLATVALNQPLLARYYAPSLQNDRNTWPKASFEWTNGSRALPSAAPLSDINDSRQ